MTRTAFREIHVAGSPAEIGTAHGFELRQEIEATIDFYATIFRRPEVEIFERARQFRRTIRRVFPWYAVEIEGIADGAKVDPLWIYALNARTELLALNATADPNECTSVYFQPTGILGQNWDWARRMEDLVVLMEITNRTGHTIRMLTEPGIIGKIGFNSCGIGVCLNFLKRPGKLLGGIPVHLILRAILDSKTIEAAEAIVNQTEINSTSNLLFADGRGNFRDVEFAGDESLWPQLGSPVILHTNHYLAQTINSPNDFRFLSSFARLETAEKVAGSLTEYTIETMQQLLHDRSHCSLPICRSYQFHPDVQEMGTVCTIIMDLKQQAFYIKKGNADDTAYVRAFGD